MFRKACGHDEGTYDVPMKCTNCGRDFSIALAKGTPSSGKHCCPRCGCRTAVADWYRVFR